MNKTESVASRLQKAMEIRGIKQVDLCEKTGIGKSSISTYLSGDYEPKQRNLYKMAEVLGVSVSWLMGYDVAMVDTQSTPLVSGDSDNNFGDLMALRERLRRQSGLRILFDASNNATEEDLLDAARLIEGFKKRREREDP